MKDVMKLGIEEARTTMNEGKGGPFGAVITDIEGKIITIASNKVLESHDPTAHAEIMAIREASEILGTHNLENLILNVTGYPCPMCVSAIMWANIKKVYYSNNLEDAEKIGFKDKKIYDYLKNNDNNILNIEQLNYDECLELFKEYQRNNKEIY